MQIDPPKSNVLTAGNDKSATVNPNRQRNIRPKNQAGSCRLFHHSAQNLAPRGPADFLVNETGGTNP